MNSTVLLCPSRLSGCMPVIAVRFDNSRVLIRKTFLRLLTAAIIFVLTVDGYAMMGPVHRSALVPAIQSGSPYFDDSYKFATITLNRGRRIQNVKTRINLETQQVLFLSFNSIEAVMDAGSVKEVSYADTTSGGIVFYKFRTGFPAADNKTRNHFYIVLAEGNCGLLQSVEKKVTEGKNVIDHTVIKSYETFDVFYLFVKGEMKRLKKEKDFILAELSDKQPQLEAYIDENKISFRSVEHIAKLINYYNTL
jgi:hypothetical protein